LENQNLSSYYRCPSNIALVKYWGKKNGAAQIPANPSISINLSDLYAETKVTIQHGNVSGLPAFSFLLDGQSKNSFHSKIETFFKRIWQEFEVVRNFHLHIESRNNFPHGTGIASSAAGFGALALCICDLEQQVTGKVFPNFEQEASKIARLGSGSACRSILPNLVEWGEHSEVSNSSNLHAIEILKPEKGNGFPLMDIVLIVDAGEKKVSSSEGHSLLDANPYSEVRYEVAVKNITNLIHAIRRDNMRSIISIVESEALQLHAMMMVSSPYYMLFRPNTVAIIEKVWEFREKSSLPVMFTLDAGANVHLLFPELYRTQIVNFIETELLPFCQNGLYFCSATGAAPVKLN